MSVSGGHAVLNIEISLTEDGRELSVDAFVQALVREVRHGLRDEFRRITDDVVPAGSKMMQNQAAQLQPRAVSISEAARLLGLSKRTIDTYVAMKEIRAVRIGRRVLIPIKSSDLVLARGIRRKRPEGFDPKV